MNADDYRRIVTEQVLALGVEVEILTIRNHGWAGVDSIHVPPVEDQLSAMIALHELGHHALHKAEVRASYEAGSEDAATAWANLPNIVDIESQAWEWACEKLGEKLLPATEDFVLRCLGTYISHARARAA